MDNSVFYEVRESLIEGSWVSSKNLRGFSAACDKMAVTMFKVPDYNLVVRELLRLANMCEIQLTARRKDPKTARELEAKYAPKPA